MGGLDCVFCGVCGVVGVGVHYEVVLYRLGVCWGRGGVWFVFFSTFTALLALMFLTWSFCKGLLCVYLFFVYLGGAEVIGGLGRHYGGLKGG